MTGPRMRGVGGSSFGPFSEIDPPIECEFAFVMMIVCGSDVFSDEKLTIRDDEPELSMMNEIFSFLSATLLAGAHGPSFSFACLQERELSILLQRALGLSHK